MEEKIKEIFLKRLNTLEIIPGEKVIMWNKFYITFLVPLVTDISELIQSENRELFSTDFGRNNYERIKSFYSTYPIYTETLKNLLYQFLNDRENILPFFYSKVIEKSNKMKNQFSKDEIEFYIDQSLNNVLTMVTAVQRIETSYKNSLDQVIDSIFSDISSKSSFFSNITQKQNQHFRDKLLTEIKSIFSDDMKKKQQIEVNILEIREEINKSLEKLQDQIKNSEKSSDDKILKSNKRKINANNKTIIDDGKKRNFWKTLLIGSIVFIILSFVLYYFLNIDHEIKFPIILVEIIVILYLYHHFSQYSFLIKSKQEENINLESENEEIIKGMSKSNSFNFFNTDSVIAGSEINTEKFTQGSDK